VRVEHQRQRRRGLHLLAHVVEARLQLLAALVLLRRLDERLRALDDALLLQRVGDVRGELPGDDLTVTDPVPPPS